MSHFLSISFSDNISFSCFVSFQFIVSFSFFCLFLFLSLIASCSRQDICWEFFGSASQTPQALLKVRQVPSATRAHHPPNVKKFTIPTAIITRYVPGVLCSNQNGNGRLFRLCLMGGLLTGGFRNGVTRDPDVTALFAYFPTKYSAGANG